MTFRKNRAAFAEHITSLINYSPEMTLISAGDDGVSAINVVEALNALETPMFLLCHKSADWWWYPDDVTSRLSNVFARALVVCFVSRNNLERVSIRVGREITNATVVWNPLYHLSQQPLPWLSGPIWRFACVGRLDPAYKGQDLLLQVLSLSRWRERAVSCSFYGTGPSEHVLKRLAATRNLQSVTFCGDQDPFAIWMKEQLMVMPSRAEGMPIALQEAMWYGRPAVVTDVGGNSELIKEGRNGFVAAFPTVGSIDDALERAWSMRERWRECGLLAARDIREALPDDPALELLGLMEVKRIGFMQTRSGCDSGHG